MRLQCKSKCDGDVAGELYSQMFEVNSPFLYMTAMGPHLTVFPSSEQFL